MDNITGYRALPFLLIFSVASALASDLVDQPVVFHLRADQVGEALLDFSKLTGIEVAFPGTAEVASVKTNPVEGAYAPRQAIELMLAGTGLAYVFDSGHSVVVAKPPAQDTTVSLSPPAEIPPDPAQLEQVTVTGTLLRGVADVIAPLQRVSGSALDAGSFGTVQDVLYTLPVSSLAGPREDLPTAGNLLRGAGVNLRGLGAGATLVLVNGHRQPVSGFNGDFVDVSNIPGAAVQRIEVLPDGASALYGSDAIAGVVNIILRTDLQGAETSSRLGEGIGGVNETTAAQAFGTRWATGRVFALYQYADRTSLDAADRAYAADADKRGFGGGNYRSWFASPANVLSPATLQPAYGLTASGTPAPAINYENQFAQYDLFPERRSHGLVVSGEQEVGTRLQMSAEARFTQSDVHYRYFPDTQTLVVPDTNPWVTGAPGAPVLLAYSFGHALGPIAFTGETRNYVGTLTAQYHLAGDWQAALSDTWGHETLHADVLNQPDQSSLTAALASPDPAHAFNPFGATSPAVLQAIRLTDHRAADSGLQTWNLTLDGPVFGLPGGAARLALGAEHRQETFAHWSSLVNPGSFSRMVNSGFAELSLPLVGNPADAKAAPRVELDLAGRDESYSDFGHALTPEVRLRWIALSSLKLRGSWERSFRAPTLVDLYDASANGAVEAVLPDPQSPTGRSVVLGLQGDNPALRAERAQTWTAGLDWVPERLPGFTASLTWYTVNYAGRIVTPGPANPYETLVEESEWSDIITRNPSPAAVAAICRNPRFFGDVTACLNSRPAAIIDLRLANLTATRTQGLDVDLRQRLGHFALGLTGTYVIRFDQAVTPDSPAVDILDTVGNPLALRLRGTLTWSAHAPDRPGPAVTLTINHTGSYSNPASALVPRVAAWTTGDVQLRYRTPDSEAWWSHAELYLNAVNILNHDPPFADNQFGDDAGNVQPLGRIISAGVRVHW